MNLPQKEQGQALMIVLLAVAAVAAVALTVSSRSTTEIATTTNVEDAQRAFSAAEAGVEQILYDRSLISTGSATGSVGVSDAQFAAATQYIPPAISQTEFVYPFPMLAGESATLWLMGHTASNQLTCGGGSTGSGAGNPEACFTGQQIDICWGALGGAAPTALEVSVYYKTSNLTRVRRIAFDPNSARRATNAFAAPTAVNESTGTCTISGRTYAYRATINFNSMGITNYASTGALQMVRARTLYNTSPVELAFSSATRLPVQGIMIDSSGTAGSATRRINAYSLFPAPPDVFEAALYSPSGLIK